MKPAYAGCSPEVCVRYVRRLLAGIAVSVFVLPTPAGASTIAFSGAFDFDNDVFLLPFTVSVLSTFEAETTSFASGGFDPVLTLFEPNGDFLLLVDDEDFFNGKYDALIDPRVLDPGIYTLALTQSQNFPAGTKLSDGFSEDGRPFFTAIEYVPTDPACTAFITIDGECRNGFFAGSLTIEPVATPVPEPGTLLLVTTGAGLLLRKRLTHRRTQR